MTQEQVRKEKPSATIPNPEQDKGQPRSRAGCTDVG